MVTVWKDLPLDNNHQIGNSLKTTKSFNSWLDNSPIPGTREVKSRSRAAFGVFRIP